LPQKEMTANQVISNNRRINLHQKDLSEIRLCIFTATNKNYQKGNESQLSSFTATKKRHDAQHKDT
jgi:hypothetical protein